MTTYAPLTIDVANLDSVKALIAGLTTERDTARNVAVRLEQENTELRHYIHLLERNAQDAIALTMDARSIGAES